MGRATAASMVLAMLLAVAGVGCNRGAELAFAQDEADSVLSYLLVDYSIGGDTAAKGPKLFFKAANAGSQDHEIEVLDDQGNLLAEIEPFAPAAFPEPLALELEPGVYTLQCNLKTEDGKVHRDLGMVTKLTVS